MTARIWLRRSTLVLLVVSVAGLTTLAVLRSRTLRPTVVGVEPPTGGGDGEGEGRPERVYKGFEHWESVAGTPIFHLTAPLTLGFSSGWHDISSIRLQLYSEGKKTALLTAERAQFNVQTRDARLVGAVRVQFGDGGFLSTERGHFESSTRSLVTDSETFFESNGVVGRAGRVTYTLADDRLSLSEGVVLNAENGASLETARLDYPRNLHRVVLPTGCTLRYGMSRIVAARAIVELEGERGGPKQIVLADGVTFEAESGDPAAGFLDGWAKGLFLDREMGGGWQFRAVTDAEWVKLRARGGRDFLERSFETWILNGTAGPDGKLLTMRAEQGVCLNDVPMVGAERSGEARIARVWFERDTVSDVDLELDVTLQGDGLRATGARARLSESPRMAMLHADPTGRQRATLTSAKGQLTSDQVQLDEVTGKAEARGNVQGSLQDVQLLGGAGGQADAGPLHFAAEVLFASDRGDTLELRDNARAWQGQRLLVADQITYRRTGEVLSAVGHVRTTLPSTEMGSGEAGDQVEVVARSLDHSAASHAIVFRGNVVFTDPQRILAASELRACLGPENDVTSVDATGSVEMTDIATGRRMTGSEAHRDTATQIVELRGSPVQLSDPKGNKLSGTSLTWDERSGTVSVFGGPDAQTETIYHPEEGARRPGGDP